MTENLKENLISKSRSDSIEDLLKVVNSVILRYKLVTIFLGIVIILIFGLYYYINANVFSYVLTGVAYIWILYISFVRLSELRLLKVEIKILYEEAKRIEQKEAERRSIT